MNRITSLLALGAIVVAGAFAGTVSQASASNVTVDFKVHNADAAYSMIRTGQSSGISGLPSPATAILPGNDDPASGFATFSAGDPGIGGSAQGWVSYANASDGTSNSCKFFMTVTHVSALTYKLHYTVTGASAHCSVPSDATNSNGQFTLTTYQLDWSI